MIQRIQSVYLLIAATASSTFFFIPISTIALYESNFVIKASGIYYLDGDSYIFDRPLLAVSSVLLFHILMTLITIFQFKNRKLQITISNLNLVLILVGMVLVFFYRGALPEKPIDGSEPTISYHLGGLLPLFSFVLIFLGRKAIKKDDELVRSAERLR